MAIKFISKSNKTQSGGGTLSVLDEDKAGSAEPSKPFIDKISLVLEPANQQDAHDIQSNIWTQFGDTSVFQSAGQYGKIAGGFKVAKSIAIPGTDHRALFQYKHSHGMAQKCRIEFNPRKVGAHGMAGLDAVLTSIIPDGWDYFIEHGRITRIDIALDLENRRMDDFRFLPPQAVQITEWRVDGHVETLYFGKSSGNQTVIYSVGKKRNAKGQPFTGSSRIRVERRLRNPVPKSLSQISKLKNPFSKMTMTFSPPLMPEGANENAWLMFLDSVRVRGLTPALALVPEDRRKQYRSHIKAHGQPWWDPESIWKDWPGVVANSGLLTP